MIDWLWWGASTNQNPAKPEEGTMEICGRLSQKIITGGTVESCRRDCRDPWKVTIEGTTDIHRRDHRDPRKVTIEGTAETCGRDCTDPQKVTMEETAEIHGRLLQKGP